VYLADSTGFGLPESLHDIDVQKMNWKFKTGVHEQTGV
jgi:hypothetical protein